MGRSTLLDAVKADAETILGLGTVFRDCVCLSRNGFKCHPNPAEATQEDLRPLQLCSAENAFSPRPQTDKL